MLRLSYFGGPGGRAEPSRLALHMAGVEYTDERIDYEVCSVLTLLCCGPRHRILRAASLSTLLVVSAAGRSSRPVFCCDAVFAT